MPGRIPCPNPACTHQFESAEVAGVDAVLCPACGLITQLRASVRPQKVPPSRALAESPPPRSFLADESGPGASIVPAPVLPRSRDWMTYSLLILGFLLLAGL